MRAYLALCRARWLLLLQYRAAALAGMSTQIVFGLIQVSIYRAFYASSTASQPMELEQVVAYVWLGQALFAMLPWRLDPDLMQRFTKGEVAYDLLRPLDLYRYWYAHHVAYLAAPACLRAGPLVLLVGLAGDFLPPASATSFGAWALAQLGSLALGAAMVTTVTLTHFWTVSGQGAATLHGAAFFLFSGMLLPLPFFPAWARPWLELLPYRGITDAPFRLYLGHLPPGALPGVLAHQLAWLLALVAAGYGLLALGRRRLVVQGG